MTKLMRRIMTAYSTYFNKQYDRVGHLFQGSYKAVRINNEAYLWHISRYIHLNPLDIRQEWQTYKYSSYPYYSSQKQADWVRPNRILDIHQEHQQEYAKFVSDYQNYKKTLHVIKSELAY